MDIITKKDKRDRLWQVFEKEIQLRAKNKDKSFVLSGKWKRFVRTQAGYKVFAVDGEWIRNNLCAYFGHGGHGLVHEFIPLKEIWITTRHFDEGKTVLSKCCCKVKKKGQKVTKRYFDSTAIHEITECKEMKKGKSYWAAHQIALAKEKDAGLLANPFDDSA